MCKLHCKCLGPDVYEKDVRLQFPEDVSSYEKEESALYLYQLCDFHNHTKYSKPFSNGGVYQIAFGGLWFYYASPSMVKRNKTDQWQWRKSGASTGKQNGQFWLLWLYYGTSHLLIFAHGIMKVWNEAGAGSNVLNERPYIKEWFVHRSKCMLGNALAEMGKLAGVTKDGCSNLSGRNVAIKWNEPKSGIFIFRIFTGRCCVSQCQKLTMLLLL